MHGICMWMSIGLCISGSEPSFIHYFKCLIICHFIPYQHGGEGRLSEKFANAMMPIVSDDLKPIKTRGNRSSFRHAYNFRRSVGCNSHGILENKYGTERSGGFTDAWPCHTIYYYIPGFIYGFMLKESNVKRLDSMTMMGSEEMTLNGRAKNRRAE